MQNDSQAMDASAPPLELSLFPLHGADGWHRSIAAAAQRAALRASGSPHQLQTWDPNRATRIRSDLYLNIGWKLRKEWLSPHRHGLTVLPQKLYFSDPGAREPIRAREDDILGGRTRPSLPTAERIHELSLEIAGTLHANGAPVDGVPIEVHKARLAVQQRTGMLFGGDVRIPATVVEKDITAALGRSGPYRVPSGFRIAIVTDEADQIAAKDYATNVREWIRSFRLARTLGEAESMVTAYPLKQVAERLEQRLAKGENSAFDGRAVLVALSGKPGVPIPQQQARLLELLAKLSIPFRCFSLDNDELKWSSRSQLMSLLQAAGGVPYALQLPMPPNLEKVALLGIDLGHPKDREESWLVISLVDRHGSLIGAYKCRQRRDETASPILLAEGLKWARSRMETLLDDPSAVIVLRDGRMHKGEHVETYYEHLGPNATLVEITKYDNPAMFTMGPRPRFAAGGSVVHPDGAEICFLCPTGQVMDGQGVPAVLKLELHRDCDGLGLGLEATTDIVAGLVSAPSLGTKAHRLPGPIYWADGIARSAPNTYKFAGQPVTDNAANS